MKFISFYLLHNSIPGSTSTPQAAKKSKPSHSTTPSEDIEIKPHLKDVNIKSKKAEPKPLGSGSGGPSESHAVMVEADLGDESYGARGADGGRQPMFVLQLKINCIRKYFFK